MGTEKPFIFTVGLSRARVLAKTSYVTVRLYDVCVLAPLFFEISSKRTCLAASRALLCC